MTPRVNIEYLENTMTIEEAANTIKDNAHTRYPVIDETPDNIIGYVHARDVLLAFIQDREKKSIKNITNPILRIPQQMRIDDVLHEFQKKNTHITIVMDEFGGTEGIATLEDVLEELVGEIADEHDVEDNVIKRIDKNTIIASGDEQIRDINDFFNVQIPGEPLDTIAETVLNTLQKSPRKGMRAEIGNVTCSLEEVKKNVITKVRIAK
ncbi:hypothetical protein C0581_04685 [Candidatus Parcubacteria bacterium]|nr:MAG: hypothetical protein C0581_04685 [Candidatus Parcubacteria bacterium]